MFLFCPLFFCVRGCDWCVFFVLSFQKSCDGVTVSEISGQKLSLTTSQTDNNINWLFEVSVNVSVWVWGGGCEEEREGRM